MVRKLALAVSLALGTASVPVYALGLGELSSKSLLNQNFAGDINLLSVKADEMDGVRVKLGDSEAFSRAGVERPFYLSLLKFEPTVTGDGRSVIRVTSDFPIREPFLNFLIEVNWPKGRLLREYTVLLDPPTTTARRAPSVTPVASSSAAAASEPVATAPEPKAASTSASAPAGAATNGASEYGPVKANDTAWSLAKKLRPGDVSMAQMMMALLAANPRAFIDGNINRLRRGQILRVPTLDEIRQLSRAQARVAYRQQQDQWLERRDERLQQAAEAADKDASSGAATASDDAQGIADQLRIATSRPEVEGRAGDGEAGSPKAKDLQSRLIIARENAETSRQQTLTLRSRVDDLQARLADMQKLLSLKDDQLAQLQDRVVTDEMTGDSAADVEATDPTASGEVMPGGSEALADEGVLIEDVDPEVLVAADESVAASQAAGGDEGLLSDVPSQIDSGSVDSGSVDSEPVDSGQIAGLPDAVDGLADAESDDEFVIIDDEAATAALDEATQDGSIAIETESGDPIAEVPAAVESIATGEPAAVETDLAESESSSAPPSVDSGEPVAAENDRGGLLPQPLARIWEQYTLPIAAGGAGLLALLAGWLLLRGRRRADELEGLTAAAGDGVAESAIEAETAIAEEAVSVEPQPMDDGFPSELADSAFLDEFSPSDINALQDETGEVDPVSEADVYIAYGRYQQAEELLGQAMERDPDRLALKHKLLEVHYATRGADAYCGLAQAMVDAGQDAADDEAWARARDMGRELAPDHALFALQEGEAALNLDLGVSGVAAVAAGTAVSSARDSGVEASAEPDSLMLDESELTELTSAYDEGASTTNDVEAPADVSILLDLEQASELVEHTDVPPRDSLSASGLEPMQFELPEAEKEGETAADDNLTDTLDLDSMMAEAEAAVDRDDASSSLDSDFSADDLQAQLDELSDLSVLDSELDDPSKQGTQAAPGGLGLVSEDVGSGDAGLDAPLDLHDAFDATDDAEDLGLAVGAEFAATDGEPGTKEDIATKLDLARAYVEIGDDDGARSILEEVVVEGNDSQRGDAKQLLSNLG